MTDPYKVLGVKYDATDDEIKKAYRTLSRQYHPDANIGKSAAEQAAAEERFKDVQQAYDQIMKDREQGIHGSAYENGGSSYGGPGAGWGYYGNPFGGQGQSAYGGNPFGGQEQSAYGGTAYAGEDAVRMQAAANYLNNRAYSEALHALDTVQDRTAQWYYFCAIAHNGMGNNVNALNYARQAASMDPSNIEYQQLIQMLEGGGQWYQSMSRGFGGRPVAGNDLCCYLCLANMLCGGCGGPMCCYI